MAAFLEFNKEKIKDNLNESFYQKFSSLYQELGANIEGLSIHFYSVYTLRRLIFLLFQLFSNKNYILQFAAHTVGSILCFIYYTKYCHMKDKSSKIILLASELVIFFTFFGIFMINFIQSEYWLDFITSFVMYGVFGFIMLECLIEVFKFCGLAKDLIKRFRANRSAKADLTVNSGISF